MTRSFLTLSLGIGALLLATQHAFGDTSPCGPRPAMIDLLDARYGESRRAIGLTGDGSVLELYASADTGSWSVLITLPNGTSCLAQAGRAFEALALAPAGDPA